jgi:hypothetical protein
MFHLSAQVAQLLDIQISMNRANNTQETVTLATPYYGSMTRPQGRPERIYLKLSADPASGKLSRTEVCVWDPKKRPDLPGWLSEQGIQALLCNDSPEESVQSFSAAGISLFRQQQEDLQEMVRDWATQLTTKGGAVAA